MRIATVIIARLRRRQHGDEAEFIIRDAATPRRGKTDAPAAAMANGAYEDLKRAEHMRIFIAEDPLISPQQRRAIAMTDRDRPEGPYRIPGADAELRQGERANKSHCAIPPGVKRDRNAP